MLSFEKVDQQNNNIQSEFLWKLLANPANDAHMYAYDLQRLVNDFPQSGILQALLAHASDNKNLKQASAYFDSRALFKLINSPASLAGVTDDRIIVERISSNGSQQQSEVPPAAEISRVAEEKAPELAGDYHPAPDNIPVPETAPAPSAQEEAEAEEQQVQTPANQMPPLPSTEATAPLNETPAIAEPEEAEPVGAHEEIPSIPDVDAHEPGSAPIDQDITTVVPEIEQPGHEVIHTEEPPPPAPAIVEPPEKQIADEVFDEIVGIEQIDINSAASHLDKAGEGEETQDTTYSAVTENHFMFDRTFGQEDDSQPVPQADDAETGAEAEKNTKTEDQQDVSKYFDEKMPYTFMWWLDKTRKEHSDTYQPYVKAAPTETGSRPKRSVDELQQQYFENIFHITSVEELDKHTAATTATAAPVVPKKKEQVIIDRFIKEEPQIKPQSSDKIDNENKAKKSSEDRDELVTETLAAIYSEQMLYHKAIASYKKLMLKFPEKSRYFADKIEQLEKKTI
jgi:hypothetical protein